MVGSQGILSSHLMGWEDAVVGEYCVSVEENNQYPVFIIWKIYMIMVVFKNMAIVSK